MLLRIVLLIVDGQRIKIAPFSHAFLAHCYASQTLLHESIRVEHGCVSWIGQWIQLHEVEADQVVFGAQGADVANPKPTRIPARL